MTFSIHLTDEPIGDDDGRETRKVRMRTSENNRTDGTRSSWYFVDDPSEGENWAKNQSVLNAHIDFAHDESPYRGRYRVAVATPKWVRRQLEELESGSAVAALLNVTLIVRGASVEELRDAISKALAAMPVWRLARLVE